MIASELIFDPDFQSRVTSPRTRRQTINALSNAELQRLSTAVYASLDRGLQHDIWLEVIARGLCGQHGFAATETAAGIIKRAPYACLHDHDADFVARVNAGAQRFLNYGYEPLFLLLWLVRECSWCWLSRLIKLPVTRGRARSVPPPPKRRFVLDGLLDEPLKPVLTAEREMSSGEIREYVKRKVWGETKASPPKQTRKIAKRAI